MPFTFSEDDAVFRSELRLFVYAAVAIAYREGEYSAFHPSESEGFRNLLSDSRGVRLEKARVRQIIEELRDARTKVGPVHMRWMTFSSFKSFVAKSLEFVLPRIDVALAEEAVETAESAARADRYLTGNEHRIKRVIAEQMYRARALAAVAPAESADSARSGASAESPCPADTVPAESAETAETRGPVLRFVETSYTDADTAGVRRSEWEAGLPDPGGEFRYEEHQRRALRAVREQWETVLSAGRHGETSSLRVSTIDQVPDSGTVKQGIVISVPATDESEVFVVGDLHGCYNNLLAVLWETDFESRIANGEDVYLVLLGDYFDRGIRVMPGLMPLILDLTERYPDRVIPLRGDHEHFVAMQNGTITSAVVPHDTLDFWSNGEGALSHEFWEEYLEFFEDMPVIALFRNGMVMTHAAIPSEHFVNGMRFISDFNDIRATDPRLWKLNTRFMMYSDPERGESYEPSYDMHGPFGTGQFAAFMKKIGGWLLVRGHEEVIPGAEFTYSGRLITVHSAGGQGNPHANGHYERSTPRYLRIRGQEIEAYRIQWERFSD